MKKIILMLIAIAITGVSFGQKKQAEDLLKQVIKKTTSYPAVETNFSLSMVNEEAGIDETKTGKLFFSGDKFRLEFPGQYVISDGKTIWTYLEDDEEVMINDAQEGEKAFKINSILTSYNDDYKIKDGGNEKIDGKTLAVIDMQPKKDNNFKEISLFVDKASNQVKIIKVLDKNKSEYIYKIDTFKPLEKVNNNLFQFSETEFPDAEINDMR